VKRWLEEDGETRGETPDELFLWLQCHKNNALLVGGGILDQPEPMWSLIQAAGSAYESWLRAQEEERARQVREQMEQLAHERARQDAIQRAMQALRERGLA
jgi:hypothetical protein